MPPPDDATDSGRHDPYFYLLESAENLNAAFAAGTLVRDDLKNEGFIHASPADQLTRVANKFYRQVKDLRCAVVEKAKVRSEIKYEPATGGLYRYRSAASVAPPAIAVAPLRGSRLTRRLPNARVVPTT